MGRIIRRSLSLLFAVLLSLHHVTLTINIMITCMLKITIVDASLAWPRPFTQRLVGGAKEEGGRRVWWECDVLCNFAVLVREVHTCRQPWLCARNSAALSASQACQRVAHKGDLTLTAAGSTA